MKPVMQEDTTGCGIAAVAAIAGVSYGRAKRAAAAMGISAKDTRLWSDTVYVRRLLARFHRKAAASRKPFQSWEALPECALLAIKWHEEGGRPFWHWVVWVREREKRYVLDSRRGLKTPVRRDFWRMKPKWSLAVTVRRSH